MISNLTQLNSLSNKNIHTPDSDFSARENWRKTGFNFSLHFFSVTLACEGLLDRRPCALGEIIRGCLVPFISPHTWMEAAHSHISYTFECRLYLLKSNLGRRAHSKTRQVFLPIFPPWSLHAYNSMPWSCVCACVIDTHFFNLSLDSFLSLFTETNTKFHLEKKIPCCKPVGKVYKMSI